MSSSPFPASSTDEDDDEATPSTSAPRLSSVCAELQNTPAFVLGVASVLAGGLHRERPGAVHWRNHAHFRRGGNKYGETFVSACKRVLLPRGAFDSYITHFVGKSKPVQVPQTRFRSRAHTFVG